MAVEPLLRQDSTELLRQPSTRNRDERPSGMRPKTDLMPNPSSPLFVGVCAPIAPDQAALDV
jgi:hypothetical protein